MFYTISDRYIDYLSKENPHVMSNKTESRTYHRKYIGLVTRWNAVFSENAVESKPLTGVVLLALAAAVFLAEERMRGSPAEQPR